MHICVFKSQYLVKGYHYSSITANARGGLFFSRGTSCFPEPGTTVTSTIGLKTEHRAAEMNAYASNIMSLQIQVNLKRLLFPVNFT